jgi:putative hydrolase of the HAD superfamily
MVLTGPPDPTAHAAMLRITGLPNERFESFYWADRHAYDEGKFTGLAYWQKFLRDAHLDLPPGAAEELNDCDALLWTTENPAMIAWQLKLKRSGILTGILSNMGDHVHAGIARAFPWIDRFEALVWSYQHHMAKPEPAIYRLILEMLGTQPEETLFVDDKLVNIEAAQALGIKAVQFTTAEKLRADLVAAGLDAEIPLP